MTNEKHIKILINGKEINDIISFGLQNNTLYIVHKPFEDSYATITSKYDLSCYNATIYFTNIVQEKDKYEKPTRPEFDDIKDMFYK
jgi:hypothetical protein